MTEPKAIFIRTTIFGAAWLVCAILFAVIASSIGNETLFGLASIVGTVAALLITDKAESWKALSEDSAPIRAVAVAQKILLVTFGLLFLMLFMGQLLFLLAPFTAAASYAGARALRMSFGQKLGWIVAINAVTHLSFMSFLFGNQETRSPIINLFFGFALILTGMFSLVLLNSKLTKHLRSNGVPGGFWGAKMASLPTIEEEATGTHGSQRAARRTTSGPASAETYFYLGPDNNPVGPVPESVLRQLAASGTVAPDTMVAREGASEWMTYDDFDIATSSTWS